MADREYDVVLFGATGFTGELTAEYLAAHAPGTTRWALAGRSADKLEGPRAAGGDQPGVRGSGLIEADVGRRSVDARAGGLG